jgi:hypothetical protein
MTSCDFHIVRHTRKIVGLFWLNASLGCFESLKSRVLALARADDPEAAAEAEREAQRKRVAASKKDEQDQLRRNSAVASFETSNHWVWNSLPGRR